MPRPSFSVVITSIMFLLSVLYALTFTNMLYVSLQEQVFAHAGPLPRYVGHVHHHNATEWILIVLPALGGWIGIGTSTAFFLRRWRRPRRAGA